MNMNQLRYFIGVAEYQSFTKAAGSYYITQTAITQQIRALENHLGVQLFDRNTRPVRLTPEGSVFLREAKAVLERVEQAEHRVREASVGLVGSAGIRASWRTDSRKETMTLSLHGTVRTV